MREIKTSIVIRSYNEERHLPSLLQRLRQQKYNRGFEIIVVDSGSIDLTREIARKYADRVVEIENDDFTFGYSLNVGIQESVGEFIAIISAHALPVESTWLNALVGALQSGNVAMVYGRQLGVSSSKFSESQDFARTFGIRSFTVEPPNFFANNANSAIRRDLWEKHKFDETLLGLEDVEWMKYWMERGYVGFYEPDAAIYHIHEETWRQIRRRYYREAVTRWHIGIQSRWDILGEFVREGGNAVLDVFEARRRGVLADKLTEIGRFRLEKALGTVLGLWYGPQTARDPQKRHDMFFDTKCKAVVIHGPRQASMSEVDLPQVKPGDVLIKVAYEGVCGTDIEIYEGSLGYYKRGVAKYPIIPGHEFSGRVVKTGVNVSKFEKGDPVVVECIQCCGLCGQCLRGNWTACADRQEVGVIDRNGGYAEYVVTPARFVHKLPVETDLKVAAMCEPIAVVLRGLRRLESAWGTSNYDKLCAVVGAGPIGHLVARILSMRGHRVTAFDQSAHRRACFRNTAIDVSNNLEQLGQFDVIVEATGDPAALRIALHQSRPGVVLLLLGLPYARQEFDFEAIVAYDKIIVGSIGSTADDFQEAIGLLGKFDLTSFVEKVVPLTDFTAAWDLFQTRKHLKVLLSVDALLNSDYVR